MYGVGMEPTAVPQPGPDPSAVLSSAAPLMEFLKLHGGLFTSSITLSLEKMTPAEVDATLAWFAANGGRVVESVSFSKDSPRCRRNSKRHTSYKAVAKGFVVYAGGKTEDIRKPRPERLNSMDRFIVGGLRSLLDQAAAEKRAAGVARGLKYFYDDGSLLARCVELMGDPVQEEKKK